MENENPFNTDKSAQVVQNRLRKKIKKLNSMKNGPEYSLDPDDYGLRELKEEKYSIYTCKFVEKKTQRIITVEIKSFG